MNPTRYAIRSLTEGLTDLTRYWSTYSKHPIPNETTTQGLPLHIEPNTWKGKFPAQVPVDLIGELQRINDAAYRPDMPVMVSYRESLIQKGYVAILENTSDQLL